jgi:hypothetical protein
MRAAGVSRMALGLDVATLARAWTSENIAGNPRSGDRGYDGFNLNQVPLSVRLPVLADGRIHLARRLTPTARFKDSSRSYLSNYSSSISEE